MHTYKDLIVWQKAMNLVVEIYKITTLFPKSELYGLVSQIRRCSVSIPSNIAEGRFRGTKKGYLNFLRIAYSSGAELETQIEISKRLEFNADYSKVDILLEEVMKMLNTMLRKMHP
ncbi:four helix bundle protein [Patescibacteria group bacterium]|nr:four helix bundle protein [Patescibacteria group bacterium]